MTTAPLSNTVDMSQYLNYPEEIEWSFFDSVGLIQTKPGMTQQVSRDYLSQVQFKFTRDHVNSETIKNMKKGASLSFMNKSLDKQIKFENCVFKKSWHKNL